MPKDGISNEELETSVNEALQEAIAEISLPELQKVKRKMLAGLVYLNDNPADAANIVGALATAGLEAQEIANYDQGVEAVTLMDLKQAESCLFKSYNFLLKNLTCDKECLKEVYKRGALFMERRRVVVTGMGVVSPVGIGVDAFWNALLAGKSGVTPITEFDATDFPVKIAGEVKDFDPVK